MTSISGYHIKGKSRGKLKHWAPLMEEWILCIERYCRVTEGDAPYWYNERANVGIVAGASWRCGWIALEEFQSEKSDYDHGDENDSPSNKWNGRCDLYICSDYSNEVIETKFKWITTNSNDIKSSMASVIELAISDASKLEAEEGLTYAGLAFLPIYVNKSNLSNADTLETKIQEAIHTAKSIDADIVAWCFPDSMKDYISDKGNYLPGIKS